MNVSNGTPGQNTNVNGGLNTQPSQGIQGQQQSMGNNQQSVGNTQQSMGNTQQPNLTKPNGQIGNMQQNMSNTGNMQNMQQNMGNMQQNMGNMQQGYQQQQQGMGYQQGYQQNPNMGYQQPMGQMGYPQQVYPVMPAKSTLGLVGLILSILSLICCGPLLAIPGIICSIIALVKNKSEKRALVGTIIGVISIVLWIVLWFTGIVSLNSLSFTDTDGNEYDIIEEVEDDYYYEDEDDYSYSDEDYDNSDTSDDVTNDIIVEEDNDNNSTDKGNTGTDIAGEFNPSLVVYNGIALTMGEYTATELEDILGYTFDEEDMEYVVNPGYYTYTTYWVEKDPNSRIIYFYFVNDTEEAIPMSECKLYRLNFYSSDYFSDDTLADWCGVDFGSGITPASTADDIIALLGKPDYVYESEEYNTYKIEYYKQFDYMYKVEFAFINGNMYEATVGVY